jgi:hypothetical protein
LAGLIAPTPLAQAWAATMSAPAPLGFMRVMRVQSPGLAQGQHMIMLPTVGGVAPQGAAWTRIGLCRSASPSSHRSDGVADRP